MTSGSLFGCNLRVIRRLAICLAWSDSNSRHKGRAAEATDVHVAIKLALFVAATVAALAPVTCDLGVEQRQRHL